MIEISSLDFKITDAIRSEIMFMEPLFQKHFSENTPVQVTLSKESPDVFKVHMHAHFLGEDITSNHSSHNFHKALELCKDHFIKMADKRKGKSQKRPHYAE